MTKSKSTVTDDYTMTISVEDMKAVLTLYNVLDSELDDILECCDVSLSQVRSLRAASHNVSNKFNFRPVVSEDGNPHHWLPKVLATDDKAWFYEGGK